MRNIKWNLTPGFDAQLSLANIWFLERLLQNIMKPWEHPFSSSISLFLTFLLQRVLFPIEVNNWQLVDESTRYCALHYPTDTGVILKFTFQIIYRIFSSSQVVSSKIVVSKQSAVEVSRVWPRGEHCWLWSQTLFATHNQIMYLQLCCFNFIEFHPEINYLEEEMKVERILQVVGTSACTFNFVCMFNLRNTTHRHRKKKKEKVKIWSKSFSSIFSSSEIFLWSSNAHHDSFIASIRTTATTNSALSTKA